MKLPKQIGFFAMIEKDGPDKKKGKGKKWLQIFVCEMIHKSYPWD